MNCQKSICEYYFRLPPTFHIAIIENCACVLHARTDLQSCSVGTKIYHWKCVPHQIKCPRCITNSQLSLIVPSQSYVHINKEIVQKKSSITVGSFHGQCDIPKEFNMVIRRSTRFLPKITYGIVQGIFFFRCVFVDVSIGKQT